MITQNMGLFGKKANNKTQCDVCDLVLPTTERLERHKKKAHGNVPEKKMDESAGGSPGEGGLWQFIYCKKIGR